MTEAETADDLLAALGAGKKVYGRGAAKCGPTFYRPSDGENFAALYGPERRWDTERQHYKVVEVCIGVYDREEVAQHVQEWLDHDAIEVEVPEVDDA